MDDKMEIEIKPKKPSGWGTRHTTAFLSFWAFAISYAMRFNLSIAIVAMVVTKKKPLGGLSLNLTGGSEEACPGSDIPINRESEEDQGEFEWNEAEQGFILGSFFYGYVLTQMPGGILSNRFGGKYPLGLGLLLTAIFALLTPVAARTHKYLLIFVRIIQGLGEGTTTPAMHEMLAQWSPPEERGKIASFVYTGAQVGTALTMFICGYLIHAYGWPSVFYSIGVFSLMWFVLWTMLVYSRPSDHPRISKEELSYIESSIGAQNSKIRIPTPWKEIFSSLPVWAIIVAHVGHAYGLYTLLTELPTYMKNVLGFDIRSQIWSAMPYLGFWLFSIVFCALIDTLIAKGKLRVIIARKTCQAISQIGSAIFLILASYAGCDRAITVTLLIVTVSINGAIYGGYVCNHADIACNHAGILMGITNTIANLTGIAAPWICGLIINENANSRGQWQIVFFIAAAIYVIDTLFYTKFASSDEQPWNRGKGKCKDELEMDNCQNTGK